MAWLTMLIKSGLGLVLLSLTCIDGFENLALRRPAWEQHPWPYTDKDYGSQNAVDGDYSDRSAAGGMCSISADNNYTEATWGVDLGEVVSISHIDIFYRTDNKKTPTTFTSRIAGFSLYVSNTTSKDDGHLCFHEIQNTVGTPSENQRIYCPFHARYVIYYNERRPEVVYPSYYSEFAYSELCEVEVNGCRNPGYFGSDCNLMCPVNCQEMRCNIITGYCLGCLPGYKDQSCKHICEKMTYGLECALNCGECRDGTSCHHVNGTCTHGCADGLYGDMCQKECPIGYYGRNCLQRCSENCYVTSRCDRVTGQCDRGCKQGWRTITCDQKCEIGYFGPDCLTKCGHCLNASFCHHINGSCLNGCSKGFKGEHCEEICPHGYFGNDCLHKCSSYCSGNGSCSRFTGVCDEGCKDGWSGLQCGTRINTECETGYFGPDCLKKCGHCFNTSQCNLINGSCLNGCSKGYKGKYCKESCSHGYFGLGCLHKCSTYCSGNGSCSHITGVCDEGCKDGWSGSQCGTRTNTEGHNGHIPIVIGVVSGIGIVIIGVLVYFALSKFRNACMTDETKDENQKIGKDNPPYQVSE